MKEVQNLCQSDQQDITNKGVVGCTFNYSQRQKLPPYYMVVNQITLAAEKFPQGVIVRVQDKGQMEEKFAINWTDTVWN